MNEYTMRSRLDAARAAAGIPKNELQFRDMRPKAATEVDEKGGTKEGQSCEADKMIFAEQGCFLRNWILLAVSECFARKLDWCPRPESNRHARY
jgi:hypothetical protein